jgi:hypothetical protein
MTKKINLKIMYKLLAMKRLMKSSKGSLSKTINGRIFSTSFITINLINFDINNIFRKYTTKRNWNEDESKLLNWAIGTYS